MQTLLKYFNDSSKRRSRYIGYTIALLLVTVSTVSFLAIHYNDTSSASRPTVELSVTGNLTVGNSGMLNIVINGSDEGTGLLGAETHILYNTNLIKVKQLNYMPCVFDTCVDTSTVGVIKLISASGVSEKGGKTVSTTRTFATANIEFVGTGSAPFSFEKCQVISSKEIAETRPCTGTTAVIAEEPDIEEPEKDVFAICGNGVAEPTEDCDDGNKVSGDGCSSLCHLELPAQSVCGNGKIETGEDCDDGNASNGDGCSSVCKSETTTPKVTPVCGNGKVETGERCDDGNTINNDGCSSICRLEAVEVPVCGNRITEGSERCDDGNTRNGDGCSAQCLLEAPPKHLDSVVLNKCSTCSTTMQVGTTMPVNAWALYNVNTSEYKRENITNTATYATFNRSVASVNRGYITANAPGTTTVTAAYTENGVSRRGGLQITVISEPPIKETQEPLFSFKSVNLTPCNDCSVPLPVGNTLTLSAKASIEILKTHEMGERDVTTVADYSSSDVNVATVENGTVTAKSAGTAVISVSYTLLDVTKTNTITVTVPPEGGTTVPDGDSAICGNNVVEAPEQCDDGNTVDGDGCSSVCELEASEATPPIETPNTTDAPEGGSSYQELHPAASAEVKKAAEEKAGQEAATVIEQKAPIKKTVITVETPFDVADVKTRLDVCRENYLSQGMTVDFDSSNADSDGDGLSNRTECYLNTNPLKADTDGDACFDGDEINQLNTDPNDGKDNDCFTHEVAQTEAQGGGTDTVIKAVEEKVLITDPQPGWTVRNLEVAGIVPERTDFVTAVLFSPESKVVQQLLADVEIITKEPTVKADEQLDSVLASLKHLNEVSIPAADAFLNDYSGEYDYDNLQTTVAGLKKYTATLMEQAANLKEDGVVEVGDDFTLGMEQLNLLKKDQMTLGTAGDLPEMDLSGNIAKKFAIVSDRTVESNKVYDLVSIATMSDGSTLSSSPIRFAVDDSMNVREPKPRSISNIPIEGDMSAFNNLWIGGVRADSLKDGVEIEIGDLQPTVSGDSEFGSQVFAVWNSVVLASSVISDSEEGAFSIQAPKNLETDIGHKVTLYAVKVDGSKTARSESVNVFFRIKTKSFPFHWVIVGVLALLALLTALVRFRKRLHKQKGGMSLDEIKETYTEEEHPCCNANVAEELDENGWEKTDEVIDEEPVEIVPESHEAVQEAAEVFEGESEEIATEDPEMDIPDDEVRRMDEEVISAEEAAEVFEKEDDR